jgi:NADPH-dependent ferric siderophore reductase
VRTERLSPHLQRVVLGGEALRTGFAPVHTDSYVKVLFLAPDVTYPEPLDLDAVRANYPAHQWPRMRSYTVRAWDAERVELSLDFVLHGADGGAGVASRWAATARPGDVAWLQGPGGNYSPAPDAQRHLLVGDESALPAIAAALERLPDDAHADVYVEVDGPADELELTRPVTWVHRGSAPVGAALLDAVLGHEVSAGTHAFVHGEAGFVKQLRRWLRVDHGLRAEQISISGYWRVGDDDEGWRAGKAAWNAEAEAVESALAGTDLPATG